MKKARKERRIETREEALALAYFLKKEIFRHQKDIEGGIRDLFNIQKRWGIDWRDVVVEDADEFVRV